jgi:hypothetical protein|tara:strand:+ start:92 stop:586 length:495 start_codon:yes stop_codon:yes gene_type:complete
MDTINIKEANLYNCEGFMYNTELVDSINTAFKTDTETGMTLHGLTKIPPRDFVMVLDSEGNHFFSKKEIDLVINLLFKFNLTLKHMATHNKYKYGELVIKTNVVDDKKKNKLSLTGISTTPPEDVTPENLEIISDDELKKRIINGTLVDDKLETTLFPNGRPDK